MSLFGRSKRNKASRQVRWAQDLDKVLAKKTKKLNISHTVELISNNSDPDLQRLFYDAFENDSEYGALLSGKVDESSFLAMLPYKSEGMFVQIRIPIQVNLRASFVNTSGSYSMKKGAGEWVCEPKDRKKSRQMNRRFPKPVVQRFAGTVIESIDQGGHLRPDGEGQIELSLYGLTDGNPIDELARTLRSMDSVGQLLSEWASMSG